MIAEASLAGSLNTLWLIFQVVVGIGFVIFVHELGHFLVAKACGVKCEKFYVGFDVPIRLGPIALPRRLLRFQWGETEYGIGIIPLGGYVKMLGQDDNPANASKEAERIRLKNEEGEAAAADEGSYELDPRSYPAKSVPQRMAIISAGVIMNLIFSVIMAAIAYRMGVPFVTAEIGSEVAGSPAYVERIEAGAKFLQLGKDSEPSEYLQFDWDLRQRVAALGLGKSVEKIDILVRMPGEEQGVWKTLRPSDRLVRLDIQNGVTLGVRSTTSTTLGDPLGVFPYLPAGQAGLKPGDKIVGIAGSPLDTGQVNEDGDIPSWDLEKQLARQIGETVTLVVERPAASKDDDSVTTLEVKLPPSRLLRLGFTVKPAPVYAIQKDSPAAAAGVQAGDRIVSIAGEAVGDPTTLSQRLADRIGEELELVVSRTVDGKQQETTLKITPDLQTTADDGYSPVSMVGIDCLGLAFELKNEVAAVTPGSSADKQGLRPGDRLLSAKFVIGEGDQQTFEKYFGDLKALEEAIDLGDTPNWYFVLASLQRMVPSTKVELKYQRGKDEPQTIVLAPQASDEFYYKDRGLIFQQFQRVCQVDSWATAFGLGWKFTGIKIYSVANMVWKLVSLQWSPKHLGGPLLIASVAGQEASMGTARLLLFLAFLSTNLAVLNFLPIPALDGGHMMFLLAEGVTRRPVDERIQGTLTLIGVAGLLLLMAFVFANDFQRLFKAFFG